MNTSKNKWFSFFIFAGAKGPLVMVVICLVISSFLGAMTPIKIAELAKYYGNEDLFYKSIYTLLIIFCGVYLNRVAYQLTINKYVKLLMQNVRSYCYRKWLHTYDIQTDQSSSSDPYPQGEVMARIMGDTESVRELMTSGSFGIFIDVFFVISCLGSFISLNVVSGLFLASMEIVAAIALLWGSKYMRDVFLRVRKSKGEMSRAMANVMGGIKESYYTPHHHYAQKKGEVVFHDFMFKQLKANVWDASFYSLAESLYPLLLALIVFIFPYSKITEAAIIFAIVDLIQRSINPIKDISAKVANLQRAYTGFIRINEFLTDLSKGHSSEGHKSQGLVALKKLSVQVDRFEYASRDMNQLEEVEKESAGQSQSFVIEDISFSALPGELIGIVGLSGCGKSTILNIMAANIIPQKGEIIIEGKNGEVLPFPGKGIEDIVHYREQIGIVSQESHIFSESLFFNITLGKKSESEFLEFWNWVKSQMSYLEHWGIGPEDKIDPQALSLGQKQLMAAIRACFLQKPIVLFDEISSALDSELEEALRKVVLLIQKNSLTFIVAHRLETILSSNRIYVMDQGKVINSGGHEELMKESVVYQEFLAELSHS
jgi:ABC-type multidrug transport system fused ATPase/permease subunit